jgi:hypothetical protein
MALQQQRKQRQADEKEMVRQERVARQQEGERVEREREERRRREEHRPSLQVTISYSTPEEKAMVEKAAEEAKRKADEEEELQQRKAEDKVEQQRQLDASWKAMDAAVEAKARQKAKEAAKVEAERISRLHPRMRLMDTLGTSDRKNRSSRFDTPAIEVQATAAQLKSVRDFELYLAHGRMECNLQHAYTNATKELRLKKGEREGWKWVDGKKPPLKFSVRHNRREWIVKDLPKKRPSSAMPEMPSDHRLC